MRPDALGYWYLRLNGFLSIVNFVVHPEEPGPQRTDVDVLAVRFPHRRELVLGNDPIKDHAPLVEITELPLVVVTEVKRGRCRLNGPWTRPADQNMHRVLAATGLFPEPMIEPVATQLYEHGRYANHAYYVTLLCLGSQRNGEVTDRYPAVPQITWDEVLDFIWNRFRSYQRQKASHPQWDSTGKELWDLATDSHSPSDFRRQIVLEGDGAA